MNSLKEQEKKTRKISLQIYFTIKIKKANDGTMAISPIYKVWDYKLLLVSAKEIIHAIFDKEEWIAISVQSETEAFVFKRKF